MSKQARSQTPFHSSVDLSDEVRSEIIQGLNARLAETADLRSQVKQAHWNVKGHHFYQLHLLFDEIAKELDEYADEVAERAVALGGVAQGTVRMAAASSSIPEYPQVTLDMDHVAALVERVAQYANSIREAIDQADELGDQTTADLYTQISRDVDKRLWFLEAHLQGNSGTSH
jgi:starvation-inducible DNA-binding protein